MTQSRLAKAASALPVLLALALVAAATWKLTLGDRMIARGDLLLYFYPLRDYASAAIREGRLPLWNPYTFMGAPFLANSQAGFFYPLNVIMAWLPAEQAVSWSIALHLAIAAAGAYALARRGMRLSRAASLACAVAFSLGGYLGAQAEHLNQLQALAWLPLEVLCLLWIARRDSAPDRRRRNAERARGLLSLALLFALQALAGHTQSLYISLVTLVIAGLAQAAVIWLAPPASAARARRWTRSLRPLLILAGAGALAAVMAAAQLLPTLELATESARSGGLPYNEAGSFSWRPWVIARALLPTYGDPLFPEYVAYLGATGLALAVLGALSGIVQQTAPVDDRSPAVQPAQSLSQNASHVIALTLAIAGFVLALGIVTPLFGILYRVLPGFSLFRAQARWLIVFALGASMLVGLGAQALRDGLTNRQRRAWAVSWLAIVGAMTAGLLVGARISPEPEYQALPAVPVMAGWIAAATAATALVAVAQAMDTQRMLRVGRRQWSTGAILSGVFVVALAVELLAASQAQPYARASDRGALTDLRPATAHLAAEKLPAYICPSPGDERGCRVLSLSSLYFDPGDLPEQRMIYQDQLSPDELYDRIVATKHKEILSPNLSLYYRLPSVDGYDGGLLPLRRFAQFTHQFAGQEAADHASDGRLREFLRAVPGNRWLEQMAVRFVVADKTQDVFIDGVFYDLLFSQPLTAPLAIALQPFESTALGVVFSAPQSGSGDVAATARITFDDGARQDFDLRATGAVTQPYINARLDWVGRRTPSSVAFIPALEGVVLRGLTSIDDGAGVFLSQMVRGEHDMRLVHSGDVKIYENLKAAPRIFLSGSEGEERQTGVTVTVDLPEQLVVDVTAPQPSRLTVRDACESGWIARVDGRIAPITCADILFRSVDIPAGTHRVAFTYEPPAVPLGLALSAAGLVAWLGLAGFTASRTRLRRSPPAIGLRHPPMASHPRATRESA